MSMFSKGNFALRPIGRVEYNPRPKHQPRVHQTTSHSPRMAGFKTHIATSTALGIGYGSAAFLFFEALPGDCLLAAGLCSVSGMLPDLDSDSGVPVRESITFAAAVVPMLMMRRF